MILVADSGSTKCDWLYEDKELPKFSTMGFNPFFQTQEIISRETKGNDGLMKKASDVSALYFYGAGCSSQDRKEYVKEALQPIFPNAQIEIDHDLIAAALATCGNEPGIACILGTGSNSVYFDKGQMYEDVPALGNRLGDEGSGSYFGRKILSGFLYKRLPQYLHDTLKNEWGLDKEKIFEGVYRNKHENVFLASHMKVLSDFNDKPWVVKMIYDGLCEFLDIHVTGYKEHRDVPVHFIGSVAYYFKDILQDACDHYGINMGKVIKQPIHDLLDYHVENK